MNSKKRVIKKIVCGIAVITVLFALIVLINLVISGQYESRVTRGNPIENYDVHKSALLVIDIQEATTGPLSMYPFFQKNSDALIENINKIADSFSNQKILVIHIRSEISNPLINLLNNSYAKGSPGAQYDKRINTATGMKVVKRAKDSFKNTNLDSILISNRISGLYLTGLDAAECINATVAAAQNRSYRVNLIREAILSKSVEMKDSMLAEFKARGVRVLNIDSLKVLN